MHYVCNHEHEMCVQLHPASGKHISSVPSAVAGELCGWRSVREGCTVWALRVGKKPARVKRWANLDCALRVPQTKRTHNVARDKAQQARARAFSLSHSLTLSLTNPLTHSHIHTEHSAVNSRTHVVQPRRLFCVVCERRVGFSSSFVAFRLGPRPAQRRLPPLPPRVSLRAWVSPGL